MPQAKAVMSLPAGRLRWKDHCAALARVESRELAYCWALRTALRCVYAYVGGGAHCYLAGYLVEDDGDQLVRQVGVGGLEGVVRAIEDYDRVAGDVCLELVSYRGRMTEERTMICFPSQQAVVTAWSLDCGLPGRRLPSMSLILEL